MKSDKEPALTSLAESWRILKAFHWGSRNDCREQSSGQIEEQQHRGKSFSMSSGHDKHDAQLTRRRIGNAKSTCLLHLAVDCSARRIPAHEIRGWGKTSCPVLLRIGTFSLGCVATKVPIAPTLPHSTTR